MNNTTFCFKILINLSVFTILVLALDKFNLSYSLKYKQILPDTYYLFYVFSMLLMYFSCLLVLTKYICG